MHFRFNKTLRILKICHGVKIELWSLTLDHMITSAIYSWRPDISIIWNKKKRCPFPIERRKLSAVQQIKRIKYKYFFWKKQLIRDKFWKSNSVGYCQRCGSNFVECGIMWKYQYRKTEFRLKLIQDFIFQRNTVFPGQYPHLVRSQILSTINWFLHLMLWKNKAFLAFLTWTLKDASLSKIWKFNKKASHNNLCQISQSFFGMRCGSFCLHNEK